MTCRTLSLLAVAFAELPGNLAEFNMAKNHLKDKGGVKFGESLQYNATLTKVNLSDNSLSDATALAINRNLLTNRSLSELNLSKNLVNIRVLELLEISMQKIRESKLATAVPIQMKQK